MRVLVLGASGMLGRDLVAGAPPGIDVVATDVRQLDIADPGAVERKLLEVRPRWVVNAAAYTQVDRAESEQEVATLVNGAAVAALAGACARLGVALVHFSTDYVFSGESSRPYLEDDATAPLGAYGRSKLLGEVGIRASGAEHLLLRTQWLFGEHGRSFARTMWERAARGEATRVVNDQWGRPTYTVDLAAATWRLVERGARGTFHVTNGGEPATWYDVARVVFDAAGRVELLSPCATADYPTPARRPAYGVLDTRKVEMVAGVTMREWREALLAFVGTLSLR